MMLKVMATRAHAAHALSCAQYGALGVSTGQKTACAPSSRRCMSYRPKIQVPLKKTRTHETPIVKDCGGKFMRWLGPGSRMQMYCALLLSGSMIYEAGPDANMLEVLATSGAICSASASVFFGAKMLCDKVVTDIVSCRNVGDQDEFVRVSVLGVTQQEVLEAAPEDILLLAHDGEDAYNFAVAGRRLELDTSSGECLNRKALNILMQGKPLVTRQGKKSKKPRQQQQPRN